VNFQVKEGCDGAMIGGSMFFNERKRVGAAALANKVPTISPIAEAVPYGLLMSYGPDFPEFFRRAAGYADRIPERRQSRRPAGRAADAVSTGINLKAAKALGLTIPQSLLVNTDDTIE
jgi:putative tryptophan/tyrosine transport system substrate-binding protein